MRVPARFALLVLVAIGVAASPATGAAVDAAGHEQTSRQVVRPVTADGQAADGWTVRRERGSADCWGASRSAVDDGIAVCGPSAFYLPSCWKSRRHTVLCLRDVTDSALVRVRYSGAYPDATAPRRPSPQGLVLAGSQRCGIRVGGAWGTVPGHPRWIGYYMCQRADVYGPPEGDGINRRHAAWRVRLVHADGTVVTRRVQQATYVGVAR